MLLHRTSSVSRLGSLLSNNKFGIVVVNSKSNRMNICTMTTLGEKIRQQRKGMGFTLDTLASAVGISKSYLWELENRLAARPSAEKLSALAEVLGQPISYFLDDKVQAPREEHKDEVFFRNYKNLEREDKEHLRQILETFRKKSR